MTRRSCFLIVCSLSALAVLSGCDGAAGDSALTAGATGVGATSPRAAVEDFLAVSGRPRGNLSALVEGCRRIAPSVRPAMRFEESVIPSDENCAGALSVMLFYAGDDGEFEAPSGLSGHVTEVSEHGDRAVVDVDMSYEGAVARGADHARVLIVREHGEWWVATPMSFNIRSVSQAPTDAELDEQYRQLADAAGTAERQNRSGREATTEIADDGRQCPSSGASSAQDARGDVKVADGMRTADQQPGSHDLVGVIHNADGSDACFELRLADTAPDEGAVEIAVRPAGGRVQVRWSDGEAVGQTEGPDGPAAVKPSVSVDGATMTIRLPADTLRIGAGPYRWAVELHTRTDDPRVNHYDSVPDDMTVMGDQDHYIPHGG
jgi:hypothetical protein